MIAGRIGPRLDRIEGAIIAVLTEARQLSMQLLVFEVATPFTQPTAAIYALVRKAAEQLHEKGIVRRTRNGEWMLVASAEEEGVPKERLAAILGMLGSAHDGEVLAAARAAEAERKRVHATWQQLLGVPSQAPLLRAA